MHTLLIEDDLDLGRALLSALKLEGISCQWCRRAADAPRSLDGEAVDCVLLDLSLPDGYGLDLLARWRRQNSAVPVIVITAREGLSERLAGLDGGADDFLVKPFAPQELASRMRAVLRRYARQASSVWRVGELEIEPQARRVRLCGAQVALSPREFDLLVELARWPDKVVEKSLLARRLVPLGEPLDFAAIEVHLSNLRSKIGAGRIDTVRGVGYRLAG